MKSLNFSKEPKNKLLLKRNEIMLHITLKKYY